MRSAKSFLHFKSAVKNINDKSHLKGGGFFVARDVLVYPVDGCLYPPAEFLYTKSAIGPLLGSLKQH